MASTGRRPAKDIISSMQKIDTSDIGLCHTCCSSGLFVILSKNTGLAICKKCAKKEEKNAS